MYFHGMQAGTRVLLSAFFDFSARGVENVPARGGALLASNHQSFLDPMLVGAAVPRPLNYMARRTLFARPWFAALIRGLNAFPVDRDGGGAAGFREALRRLKSGRLVLVFPEGTRSESGLIRPLKPGLGRLAAIAGVPVVPVVIRGAGEAWPRSRRFCRPWPIRVRYGPPLAAKREDDPEAFVARIHREMLGLQRALQQPEL